MKFKAQIWEINFLGPGKEKGRGEGGERGSVLPSVGLSKRLVGQEKKHRWARKSPIMAPSEGARKEQYKIYLKVYCSRLGLHPPPTPRYGSPS